MTDTFYIAINQYMHTHPRTAGLAAWANRLMTAAVFCSYPLLLLYLFFGGVRDIHYITIPAGGFAALTLVRAALHQKRPYERLPITPLIKKETKGKSFPSRHVFCAFMIAMTYLAAALSFAAASVERKALIACAILLFVMADLMADVRVLLGVHFLRDTAAGAISALFCGLLFFF